VDELIVFTTRPSLLVQDLCGFCLVVVHELLRNKHKIVVFMNIGALRPVISSRRRRKTEWNIIYLSVRDCCSLICF